MKRIPCDANAIGAETATYTITSPSGTMLALCEHHARAILLKDLPDTWNLSTIGAAPVELYMPAFHYIPARW